ncbi:hypothetical protein [Erythrobacter alti]|uniref:hypothetical protein n=1 Tax=Erythrobacter alti TaxID=1896145 RepID=UPI0030F4560E
MSEYGQSDASADAVGDMLRAELAHGDAVLATTGPIIRHLLLNDDHTLFNDQVIAHIRGMTANIARQLIFAVVEQDGAQADNFIGQRTNMLAAKLLDEAEFLSHLHALAIETLVSERLSQRIGIDPVRSPFLQELAVSSEQQISATAMRTIAAQARFVQQGHRMELAITELPQELFDLALSALIDGLAREKDAVAAASAQLREYYDPSQRRAQHFATLVGMMEANATEALEIDRAGLAFFSSTLSLLSDQPRDFTILSLGEKQSLRLAVELCSAGLEKSLVEEQLHYLHPDLALPEGFENLTADDAMALLAKLPSAEKA